MTYSVVWSMVAIAQLNLIMQVADPAAVRAAADRIDRALRRTPRDMGESRQPGWRLWYEDLLGVRFYIDEAQMRVEVHLVGLTRRR